MKKRVLVGLLALSLLFNVFVLLGFARAKRAAAPHHSEEQVVRQVASELKLDDKQAEIFGELRKSMRRDAAALNENIAIIRQRMVMELRSEAPDLETVRNLVDEETELLRQRRYLGAETFNRFVKELSPPQRQAAMRHMSARPPRSIPPHLVKRFDADQNGALDPKELDAAMEDPQFSRQPRPPRMQAPGSWQRFDQDRNGILDAAELAQMDEFWRERSKQHRDRSAS